MPKSRIRSAQFASELPNAATTALPTDWGRTSSFDNPLGAELPYMPARLVTLDARPTKFHRTEKENASKKPERSFFDVA